MGLWTFLWYDGLAVERERMPNQNDPRRERWTESRVNELNRLRQENVTLREENTALRIEVKALRIAAGLEHPTEDRGPVARFFSRVFGLEWWA